MDSHHYFQDDEPPWVRISAIEHYEYCPRQCALIYSDGVWADNQHTVKGTRSHRRVDNPAASKTERGIRTLRAVPLWSERYGLTGRADVVEILPNGAVYPVEHKAGIRHGLTADLQLCAQAICLEDMLNIRIDNGAVWYEATRRRHPVTFSNKLRNSTLSTVTLIRDQIVNGILPPAPNDERCNACQLRHHCLPEVVARPRRLNRYLTEHLYSV